MLPVFVTETRGVDVAIEEVGLPLEERALSINAFPYLGGVYRTFS
jgi:hypothetical protein